MTKIVRFVWRRNRDLFNSKAGEFTHQSGASTLNKLRLHANALHLTLCVHLFAMSAALDFRKCKRLLLSSLAVSLASRGSRRRRHDAPCRFLNALVQIPVVKCRKTKRTSEFACPFCLAEKQGFEPWLRSSRTTPLAGEPLRPLGYFSLNRKRIIKDA